MITILVGNRDRERKIFLNFEINLINFQPKSKMDPFKFYTFEEAIVHEMVFLGSQPQEYSSLINNIQRVVNLVCDYKL